MSNIQIIYHKLNIEHFDGQLPFLPCFFNGRLSKTLGRCHFERKGKRIVPIKIDIQKGLEEDELQKTLIHEMCHVWAMVNHQERGHGPWFWKKMTELGYPKGHVLETGSKDRWSAMEPHDFKAGDDVYFYHQGKRIEGQVIRVNKKTLTILSSEKKWRASAGLLQKVEKS